MNNLERAVALELTPAREDTRTALTSQPNPTKENKM
jgi:hypothetical protein